MAWDDTDCKLGKFDLIIGSDVLYEREHAEQLSIFIDEHAEVQCEVIIVDPGRRQHGRFSTQMAAKGYRCSELSGLEGTKKVLIMHYQK